MPLTWPLITAGATGEDVKTIQYLLKDHGATLSVDGVFGALTKSAVESFQAAHGLTADGEVGSHTWPKLLIEVSEGDTGDAVRALQSQLHSRGDGAAIAVDGAFGPITSDAAKGVQRLLGLTVDGIAGPLTWNALVDGYLTAPDPETAAQRTFAAWSHHDQAAARKDATPGAVAELFTHNFATSDGWNFEGCQGAAGHTFCSWRRTTGRELRIGVENAVVAPVYAADEIQFT